MLIDGYYYPTEPLSWLRATFKVAGSSGFRRAPSSRHRKRLPLPHGRICIKSHRLHD